MIQENVYYVKYSCGYVADMNDELINLEIILIITDRYVFHHVSACPTASDDLVSNYEIHVAIDYVMIFTRFDYSILQGSNSALQLV